MDTYNSNFANYLSSSDAEANLKDKAVKRSRRACEVNKAQRDEDDESDEETYAGSQSQNAGTSSLMGFAPAGKDEDVTGIIMES